MANAHSCINELEKGAISRLSDLERRQGHSFWDDSTNCHHFNSQNQFLLFQGHIYKQRLPTVSFALTGYQKNALADEFLRNRWGLGQLQCVSGLFSHCQSTPSFPANPLRPPVHEHTLHAG